MLKIFTNSNIVMFYTGAFLGNKVPEIIVEVLEAFGRALKVCFTDYLSM